VLIDGEALEEVDFVEEVAGSLGAFATANQFSVGSLKERLKQKDMQISQLQNQMKTVEKDVWSEPTRISSILEPTKRKSNSSNPTSRRCTKMYR
jgi:hypothetical protein